MNRKSKFNLFDKAFYFNEANGKLEQKEILQAKSIVKEKTIEVYYSFDNSLSANPKFFNENQLFLNPVEYLSTICDLDKLQIDITPTNYISEKLEEKTDSQNEASQK